MYEAGDIVRVVNGFAFLTGNWRLLRRGRGGWVAESVEGGWTEYIFDREIEGKA